MSYEDGILEEIERIQDAMKKVEPGSEEHSRLVKEANTIIAWWQAECKAVDETTALSKKNDLTERELDIEKSKLEYQYKELEYRKEQLELDRKDKLGQRVFKWAALAVTAGMTVFSAMFSAYRDDVGMVYDKEGNIRSRFSKDAQRKYDNMFNKSKDKLDKF